MARQVVDPKFQKIEASFALDQTIGEVKYTSSLLNFFYLFVITIVLTSCKIGGSTIDSGFLGGIHLDATRSTMSLGDSNSATAVNTLYTGQTITAKLRTNDQNGALFKSLTSLDITFSLGGGTSGGTFSAITDNGDGTYTSVFTAQTAGTVAQLQATIGSQPVTTASPQLQVMAGTISLANSVVTVSAGTVLSGSNTTVTFTAKDNNGNPLTTGGLTVLFTNLATGTSTGTFSPVVDNGNGTYTAQFTGILAGSATRISAQVSGQSLTSAAPLEQVLPGPASQIIIASGNSQTGVVGNALANAFDVVVKDTNGNVVSGSGVTWSITSGGGTLSSASTTTDSFGHATSTLTLGHTTGTPSVRATLTANGATVDFTTTALPGAINNFTFTLLPSTATAGTAIAGTITAFDSYGNVKTNYVGSVHFTSTDTGSPTLPADYAFVTADNGAKSFSFTLKTSGSQTLTATQVSGGSPSVTSGAITVSAGAATQLAMTTGPVDRTAGQAFTSIVVRALDAFGNTATSFTGSVAIAILNNPGSSTLSGTAGVSATSGSATFTGLSLNKTGTAYTLQATSSGLTAATSLGFAITPSTPSTIAVLLGNSQTGTVAMQLASPLIAVVKDAYSNVVPGATVDWAPTAGAGSVSISQVSTDSAGTASTQLTLGNLSGTNTVTATVHSTAITTSFTATAQANSTINSIAWVTAPVTTYTASSSTAMTSFQLKLLDSYGNTITGNNTTTVTLSLQTGTGSLGGTVTKTAASGLVTFSDITYTKAESITIRATENTAAHTLSSSTIVVSPNVPDVAQSAITTSASSVSTDGATPVTVTITLKDTYGNPTPSQSVSFSSTGTGNTLTQPGATTNASGQSSGSMVSTVAESKTLAIATPSGFTADTRIVTFVTTAVVAANSSIAGTTSVVANGVATSTVTIVLQDNSHNPVAGITPNFSASGTGNVYGSCSATDASGSSTCTMTSTKAEAKTLSLTGPVAKTGPSITFIPGPATNLVWTTQPVATSAGVAFSPQGVIAIRDAQGNTVTAAPDATATITLTLQSGTGTLLGTLTKAAVAGVADFSGSAIKINTSGSKTIRATKPDTTGSSGTVSFFADSGAVTVAPGAATQLVASGFPTSITAGSSNSLTVTALDTYGNVATSYVGAVTLTSNDAQFVAPSAYTFTSGTGLDNGVHVFSSLVLKTKSTTASLTATDGGALTSTQSSITVLSSTADHLVKIAGDAQTATVGGAVATNPKVQVQDIYSNPVSGVALTLTSTNGATPGATSLTTDSSGYATTTLTLGNTAGANSLTFARTTTALPGTPATVTFNETGAAGAAVSVTVTGFPASVIAGSSNSVTVTAYDNKGNVAPSYVGTVHFTTTSAVKTVPADYTFTSGSGLDNGAHTFTGVKLSTTGTQSLTATDTVTGSITGVQTGIVVSPATAATLAVTGFPLSAAAGSSNSTTVTVLDAFGNTATGYIGQVHFSTTSALKTLPSDYTFTSGTSLDNGAHTFTGVQLNTSGAQTLTATDTTTGSITGTETGITINAAAADHMLKIAGDALSATAGSAIATPLKTQIVDSYGNAVSGVSVTFVPSAGSVSASPVTTDSSGYAQTTWTLGTTAGAQTLTVARQTTALPGTPATLTFTETATPGLPSATTSTIVASSGTITADGNNSVNVVITLKDANGNAIPSTSATYASTGTGNTLTQPVSVTDASGQATGSFKTTVAESKTLSIATPSGLTSVTTALTASYPTLTIAPSTVNEGTSLSFVVTLSSASTQTVTVGYASSNGTAVSGTSYTATSGTLTITAGSTTGTITVPTTDDTVYTTNLAMAMTLSSPVKATIATASATGTITNTDAMPSIVINDVAVNEAQNAVFTVTLSNKSYQAITVAYATANGTAISGTNYTTTSGTLSIPAGSLTGTITVPTINDNVYAAAGLTFNVNLTSPTNATIADNVGIGTINNINTAPTVQLTTSTQSVNQAPSTQTLTVTAQLSVASGSITTVPFTLSGTGVSGTDYSMSGTSISIAAGSTTGTVTLTAINLATPGNDKTAIITLGTPTGATLGATTVDTVTVVNNNYPSVTYSLATQDAAINQGTATVTVTLSPSPVKTVTVPITISGSSTAVAGTDYTLTAPTLTFTSGVTTQTFNVTIIDHVTPTLAPTAPTLILGFGTFTNGVAGATTSQTISIQQPTLDLNFTAMYDPATQISQAPYNQLTFTRRASRPTPIAIA